VYRLAVLLLLTLLFSCGNDRIEILSESSYLVLPLRVSEFTGLLDRERLNVRVEPARDEGTFFRLLNISRFNGIIVDSYSLNFIEKHDSDWVRVCSVATKKPAIIIMERGEGELYAPDLPIYRQILKGIPYRTVERVEDLLKMKRIAYSEPLKGYRVERGMGRVDFYLCVRKSFLSGNPKAVSKLLKAWEEGVTYLKDRAVFEYILERTGLREEKSIRFRSCFE